MRKLSLFSGIGGIDLAAHWAGMETVAFCEREPFPQKVLRKHWPDIPIYDDVCTLTAERLKEDGIIGPGRTIDLVSAGYPCQPESLAGERKGEGDDRWLWPEVCRILQEVGPRWFVGENVFGHVSMGLDTVLSDLENNNYTAEAIVIPAAAIGAPHRRDRVIVLGYTECFGCGGQSWGRAKQVAKNGYLELEERVMANSSSSRQQECNIAAIADRSRHSSRSINARGSQRTIKSGLGGVLDGLSDWLDRYQWPAGLGAEQYEWEPPRVATGVKDRVGRLKGLGNAVNPRQIYPVFAAIKAINDQL
jgi:DNA (cytosine-5)-methyltransferase 1